MTASSRIRLLRFGSLAASLLVTGLCGVAGPTYASPSSHAQPLDDPAPAASAITLTITQTGQWNGGFGANLDITNNTDKPIDGWTLAFDFAPAVDSLWNGDVTHTGTTYTVTNLSWNGTIPAGGKISLGMNGSGALTVSSATNATLNGAPVDIKTVLNGSTTSPIPTGGHAIQITGADGDTFALQITIPQGNTSFPLKMSDGSAGTFQAVSNNTSVVTPTIGADGSLQLNGLASGRAGLKLVETGSNTTRYVGVRVKNADGTLPGMPSYLSLGSVSEDTDTDLNFWHSFEPGAKNKRMDVRYIYLNGGPEFGWVTWTGTPGDRAVKYMQNSKMMGMIPYFVFYNIPDGGESFTTDRDHLLSADYMKQYYQMLKFTLDLINKESPDDPVGIILEPDSLGYMAQSIPGPASGVSSMTHSAYDAGVLVKGTDPDFADNLQGTVQSINYIIHKFSPQVYFGWQMNLWASPQGGWTTPIPGNGLMHKTDDIGVAKGRPLIYTEAAAITKYYLDAGVATNGAKFISIDKYGLDAGGAEASAGANPAGSLWFWNNDEWGNYLAFVKAMHDTSKLPVVLWQLPVGHINHSLAANPYDASGVFPDLANQGNRQSEDSTPTYFFGDTFSTTGPRFDFFSKNDGADPKLTASGSNITWGEHMSDTAAAGVTLALFGAGVGASTTNVGSPPSDGYWWITKSQQYYDHLVSLTTPWDAGGTVTPPTPTNGNGDVNGDGKVNVQDATLVLQMAVGSVTPTAAQTAAADINGDGKVNVQDATAILRKAVGL